MATNEHALTRAARLQQQHPNIVWLHIANATGERIHILYHPEGRQPIYYGSIAYRTYAMLMTFVSHKWSFRRDYDGEYMMPHTHLNGEQYPLFTADHIPTYVPRPGTYSQVTVVVLNRLRSLKTLTISRIAKGNPVVNSLPLPNVLKDEISEYMKHHAEWDKFLVKLERPGPNVL